MHYNNSGAKYAFMGYDDSDGKFVMIPDASDTSNVFSGSVGTLKANIEGDIEGNATKVKTTQNNTHSGTVYIPFVMTEGRNSGDTSGTLHQQLHTDNQLYFNPSTGYIRAENFQGN